MPKHRKPEKKPIEQYDHKEASRANNPPVGLVTPETDRDAGEKTYAYDPHIDPSRHNRCDAQEEWQWTQMSLFLSYTKENPLLHWITYF